MLVVQITVEVMYILIVIFSSRKSHGRTLDAMQEKADLESKSKVEQVGHTESDTSSSKYTRELFSN